MIGLTAGEILETLQSHRFERLADVNKYLGGEKIECLVCGHAKYSLAKHLSVHGVSSRTYKAALNIPISRPLISLATLEKLSDSHKNDKAAIKRLREHHTTAVEKSKLVKRLVVPMTRAMYETNSHRGLELLGLTPLKVGERSGLRTLLAIYPSGSKEAKALVQCDCGSKRVISIGGFRRYRRCVECRSYALGKHHG